MKIKEWLERNRLTLEDEIPSSMAGPEVFVSEELTEGLSAEDADRVRLFARDCRDLQKVETYAGWLRAGDVGMWNEGASPSDAKRRILSDLKNIQFYEGLVPVEPYECFSFKLSFVEYAVVMRFRKE